MQDASAPRFQYRPRLSSHSVSPHSLFRCMNLRRLNVRSSVFRHPLVLMLASVFAIGVITRPSLGDAPPPFIVQPAEVQLKGPFSRAQLLVTTVDAAGMETSRSTDLTHQSKYTSSDPKVVTV